MIIDTLRFGPVEIDEQKIVTFRQGIPGLEDVKRFALIVHEATQPICWLQAVDKTEYSLPVIDPFIILPNYAFDILQEDVDDLSIAAETDVHILSVLVIPKESEKMTINLAAPIIINVRQHLGKQIFIDGKDYVIKEPVYDLIQQKVEEVDSGAGFDKKG